MKPTRIIISLILGCSCFPMPIAAIEKAEIVDIIQSSTWDFAGDNCDNPRVIDFDFEKQIAKFDVPIDPAGQYDEVPYFYNIVGFGENFVRMAYQKEERLAENGELVVWDLRVKSQTVLSWHRTDWDINNETKPLEACDSR